MVQLDHSYYRKRAETERAMAAAATDGAAAEVHRLMAEEYQRRARKPRPAERSDSQA